MRKSLVNACLLASASLLGAQAMAQDCGQTPVDPLASQASKNLLCYLKSNTYITGQTDLPDAERVRQLTGRYPAIVAFDFYNYTDGNTGETQKAIQFAQQQKGIVAFQWHWKCPRGGGQYSGNCDFDLDLNNPGSNLYRDIDLVVSEIRKMGDAGVPVLFRPLHEANNNYMWWARKGQDNYKRLWRLIFERARLAGAHNILWVFNGMASGQGSSLASWYPGDQYVDVVSSDYFQSWSDYNTTRAVGSNKVVGIAETMNQLNPASDAPWNFSVVWASRDWNSRSSQDWITAMANPRSISIDQLPDFNQPGDNPSDNIALGKAATASSTEGPGYEAAKAVDGNTSSRWASALNASSASYTIDLGGQYDISGLSLRWEAAYASAYQVQMSSDGVNFSNPIYNTSSGRGGVESISASGQGRYLRINMSQKANPAWGYSLWEVQVNGSLFSGGSSSAASSASSAPASSSVPASSSSPASSSTPASSVPASSSSASSQGGLSCSLRQTGSWSGGYQLEVQVSNSGPARSGWTVYLEYPQAAQITSSWNATLSGNNTTRVTASHVSYNANLGSGASTSFGLTGNSGSGFALPRCTANPGEGNSSSSQASSSATSSLVSSSSSTASLSSSSLASSSLASSSQVSSSQASSSANGDFQAVATHFESFGIPYGGCGIPQDKLETPHFVALNVFHSPGNYAYWPRPLSGANLAYLGEFNNGKNCGRWVRVSIQEDCNGLNDGAKNQPFCRNGSWVKDGKEGASLDMLVADSCGDDNAWCRDSRYHLDLATASVTNQFLLNGAPVTLLPGSFNNRKISWQYIEAPNYQGDIRIHFMQGAEQYWPAIAINHLKNGIHGVEQLVNGSWVKVPMNSDMGQSYILQGGVSQFQIRVYDANDQLINAGRVYSFGFPAACGSKCSAALTQVNYSIQ